MASATHTESPHDERPPSLATWFMPWLLSTASHLALILLMAVLVEQPRGIGEREWANEGILLTAVQLSDGGGSEDSASDTANSPSTVIASPTPPVTELSEPVEPEVAKASAIELHPNGELASIDAEIPPLDLESVVPETDFHPQAPTSVSGDDAVGATKMLRRLNQGDGGRGNGTGSGVGDGTDRAGIAKALAQGAAQTGVFGVSGTGYKFVYVFDRSGSMDGHGGAPLMAAKTELIHSLRELGKMHQFQIIFYNEEPRIFTLSGNDGRLTFATEQNRRLAERFVNGITADGATQHEDALAMALRMNPDVIFFLTDADEPALSARQLARLRRMSNGTVINAIEFGYGPRAESENFLVWLARQNGGQHVYVDISELPRP